MIKNIIFDLGNVLLYGNPVDIVDNLIVSESNKDVIKSTFFSNWEKLDIGKESLVDHFNNCQFSTQIDEDTKAERADSIMRRQVDISRRNNMKKIGEVFEVIVDGMDEEGAYLGRTVYDAPEIDNTVIFSGDDDRVYKPGDMVKVRITDAFDYDLTGTVCG